MSDAAASASHLDPTARALLSLPDAQRIARIDRDIWIGYGRAIEIHNRLEQILFSERRMRPDNLLVTGASNNGKTAIARRFLARHTLPEDPNAECATIPVVMIQAPNGPRIPQLLGSILTALGRTPVARRTTAQLRDETYKAIEDVGLRLLLIDDLHNIRGPGASPMLVELREIGSATGVSLGGFATREIAYVLRQDDQLANRLTPYLLPRWKIEDNEYFRLLATLQQQFPLRHPSCLTDPDLASRLLASAEGLIGGVIAILRRAAGEAIRMGHERIDASILSKPGILSPARWDDIAAMDTL